MSAARTQALRTPGPRYASLAETLVRDVTSGKYGVGTLLPTEVELMRRYGVSRHTVREATRKLVDMGLVTRHPGIGTRVRQKAAEARYVASLTSIGDLIHYTQETWLEVLGEESIAAEGRLAEVLRCRPGQHWFVLRTLRYPRGKKEPISYTEIYLQPQYEGLRRFLVKGKSVTIYSLIEQHYGERIVEVQQDISAVAIPPAQAKLLGERPRSPGLHVLRYYIGTNDRLLAMSINTYHAKRFQFSTRWRLEWDKPGHATSGSAVSATGP
ncbi:MAG TPA: GntR family transcriptional regulator [Burkholderiales bacterium]|nr:GntR family transcriptional regulator [Burkholderiales bacterium]